MRTSKNDRQVVERLANEDYGKWISSIRETLQAPESPLSFRNGTYTVRNRKEIWEFLGGHLFDDHLDRFREIVVDVLREPDPMFELPPKERFAANIRGKVPKHSQALRKGLCESLALLGTRPDDLKNCSLGKAEDVAITSVRAILQEANWILWGSLNNLLPTLAEAAPEEFLHAVGIALSKEPCPFDELFSQEGNGITGTNYLTGLLWALETLAWEEEYLVRTSVLLGKLAARDPGGNWGNRPANSLSTIFLPWLPQTIAPLEKRKAAIRTLQKELPEIAWRLLLDLLPNQHQTSMGCHKPVWRKTIPDDGEKRVMKKEYWDQISSYADIAVEMAKGDFDKLKTVISHLNNLPEPSLNSLLEHLESPEVVSSAEAERMPLWTALVTFATRHRRHSDAKRASPAELVDRIEQIAKKFAPENPLNVHRRLFDQWDTELYEMRGDYEEQRGKLEERRNEAIQEIFQYGGFKAVFDFALDVKNIWGAGFSFGIVADENDAAVVFPDLLLKEDDKTDKFVGGFVLGQYKSRQWELVEKTDTGNWTKPQIGKFLSYLPSTTRTWEYAKDLLGDDETEYWTRANVNPFEPEVDLGYAVEKLLEHGRPNEALRCLWGILHAKKPLDTKKAVTALLQAITSDEPPSSVDTYNMVEIIQALQADPEVDADGLCDVEWAYLPVLTGPGRQAQPKTLERKLASESDFFCEAIRTLYRSKKKAKSDKEPTEQEKAVATNVWRLLNDWKTVPGMQDDASFSVSDFNEWLGSVKRQCEESGHLDVALSTIGAVLIHYIPDPDGLWIHKGIAEVLNAKDAGRMRHGFSIATINARGVHWVDPTGKPEMELAAKYKQQAEEVENAGYYRFADTFRGLADSYERQAKEIIAEHEDEHETEEE